MVVTPLTEAYEIDASAFRSMARSVAAGGNAIWVASQGSGEGLVLTAEERRRLYKSAADEVGRQIPVLAAGIGLSGTSQAIEDTQAAFEAGVAGVQLLPPRPGPVAIALRDDELRTYYDDVLNSIEGPVYLANNGPLSGVSLSVQFIAELVERYQNVVGVNYTDFDFRRFADLALRIAGRVELRSGIVSQLPSVRLMGGSGILCFEPNVDARAAMSAWEAHADQDCYQRLMTLNRSLSRAGNPRSIKAALQLQERGKAVLRKPLLPPTPEEFNELRADLDALGLLDVNRD